VLRGRRRNQPLERQLNARLDNVGRDAVGGVLKHLRWLVLNDVEALTANAMAVQTDGVGIHCREKATAGGQRRRLETASVHDHSLEH